MGENVLSIAAIVVSLVVGIALIVLYKKRVVDGELLGGTAAMMSMLDLPETPFGMILRYARTAVLTVEQMVKTGLINKDDEARRQKAMEIIENAAIVDDINFGEAEKEVASACIEAEVNQLPRNQSKKPPDEAEAQEAE